MPDKIIQNINFIQLELVFSASNLWLESENFVKNISLRKFYIGQEDWKDTDLQNIVS